MELNLDDNDPLDVEGWKLLLADLLSKTTNAQKFSFGVDDENQEKSSSNQMWHFE